MLCVPNILNKDIPVTFIIKNVTKFKSYVSRAKNKEQIYFLSYDRMQMRNGSVIGYVLLAH